MGFFGLFGHPDVVKLEAKRNVEGLIKALGYHHDRGRLVRVDAAKALGKIGDTRAVEPLIATLKKESIGHNVRVAAAEALGKIGDARAMEPLIAILKENESIYIREAAADALGKFGDARAVEPLVAILKQEKYWPIRQAAAEALDALGWKPGEDAVGAAYWILKKEWDECVPLGSVAVEPLIAALQYWEERAYASSATLQMAGPFSTDSYNESLMVSMQDNRSCVCRAAEALGQIGDSRAVVPLIKTFNADKWPDVRTATVLALGKVGGASTVEMLITVLESGLSDDVREAAAEALGKIGDARAVEPLTAIQNDRNPVVRARAVEALSRIGGLQTKKALLQAGYDSDIEASNAEHKESQ